MRLSCLSTLIACLPPLWPVWGRGSSTVTQADGSSRMCLPVCACYFSPMGECLSAMALCICHSKSATASGSCPGMAYAGMSNLRLSIRLLGNVTTAVVMGTSFLWEPHLTACPPFCRFGSEMCKDFLGDQCEIIVV